MFIIPAFSVHVVVWVIPPPPVIIMVGGVVKLPPAVMVKEVNKFVVYNNFSLRSAISDLFSNIIYL